MNHRIVRFAIVVVAVLCGWSHAGRFVSITLLHTCDLHGHVRPTHDYEGNDDVGGMARCAAAIREIREKEDNVLLVDVGDTVQGTPASLLTGGLMMVRVLNHLQYDAWVPGNHEFDWGIDKLAACIAAAEMPVLNADLRLPPGGGPHGTIPEAFQAVRPFTMREVDGVRVAIIGLNTPGIPGWNPPSRLRGLHFADSVAVARNAVQRVEEAGADIVILAVHQGFRPWGDDEVNRISALGEQVPGVDVILGAHTHRLHDAILLDDTLYTQAGYHGTALGRVDMQYDRKRDRVSRRSAELIRMDASIAQDPEVLQLCREDLERADRTLKRRIGVATERFPTEGAPRHETAMHNLFFDSIRTALAKRDIPVDAVLHGVLNHEYPLFKGPVFVHKVWQIVPYENTVVVLKLKGRHLRAILDHNASRIRSYKFLGIGGLKLVFDPKADTGSRVLSLKRPDGTPVGNEDTLTIAMNSYDFAGWRQRAAAMQQALADPHTEVAETGLDTRTAVTNFIHSRKTISPHTNSWWTERRRQ